MKKYIFFFALASLIYSCGNNPNTASTSTKTDVKDSSAGTTASMSPEAQKGLELVAKSDCLTCHKISETLVGPAYQAVAQKYPPTQANIDTLAQKIIHGGSGNWGATNMTAHQTISEQDAQTMVKYILSLKQ